MSTWYKAEVVTTEDGKGDLRQTVEGNAKSVAAWLRAVAAEMDPPRPALRVYRNAPASDTQDRSGS